MLAAAEKENGKPSKVIGGDAVWSNRLTAVGPHSPCAVLPKVSSPAFPSCHSHFHLRGRPLLDSLLLFLSQSLPRTSFFFPSRPNLFFPSHLFNRLSLALALSQSGSILARCFEALLDVLSRRS